MAIFVLLAANPTQAQLFGKRPFILVGQQQPAQLNHNTDHRWFQKGVADYASDQKTIDQLKNKWKPNLQIIAFGGSWCPDTHREMPGFFKVLQDANIPEEAVELYFLDRSFDSGTDLEEKYQVTSVPTFVVLRSGKEIGRIKHKAKKPAEEMLLNIIE